MIHQPLGGVQEQAADIKIHAEWIIKTRQKLNQIYVDRTGQPLDKIERDTDRDFFMSAEEAKRTALLTRCSADRSIPKGVVSCLNLTMKGQLKCSFCGKSQEQVRKLVAGPGVYICDECIELCTEIVEEELGHDEELDLKDIPKPKEIRDILDQYILLVRNKRKITVRSCVQPLQAD